MTPELESKYKAALQLALNAGYTVLETGGTATEAVEKAVVVLENSPLFNAGKGSVFTATESHEMDASIMDGKTLNAGAVSLITGIKNPISLARDVMEKSEHVFLAGEGAMQFAKQQNYKLEDKSYFYDALRHNHLARDVMEKSEHVFLAGEGAMQFAKQQNYKLEDKSYFYDALRHNQWLEIKDTDSFQLDHAKKKDSKFGTVGAVACDKNGNIAAATSTGGMTNKKWGRVGDSPMIGAGNYANNKTCAISCTGSGEFFIRGVVAYDVACLMEHKAMTVAAASNEVINKRILELGGDGGLIAVDAKGNIAMPFNTE
eukprot:maker-scaffold1964_size23767-snap-gene-0.0 protein:Tk11091 transcript:maker-scaffold1964_size23767-snap-gene-0.0-mRNA-1 annotation:"isoaspartyl peptidase"